MKRKIATLIAMVTMASSSAFADVRDCPEIDKTLADVNEYLTNSWLSPKHIGQVAAYSNNDKLKIEIQRVHGILTDSYRLMIIAANKGDDKFLAGVFGDIIPVSNKMAEILLRESNKLGLSEDEASKIRADAYNLTQLTLRAGVARGCIEHGR